MSTKINVRSPYYLRLEEPTETLGAFTCDTAGLSNFSISDNGNIRTPDIRNGRIIQASDDSFAANTSGSSISRTVTYTIGIPDGYSNSNLGSIDCDQSFDQPTQPSIQDPNTNNNCPTVSTQPTNFTATSSDRDTTYTLTSIFTAGSGASINRYAIRTVTSNGVTHSISGSTATFTVADCGSGTFYIRAFNDTDNCYVDTNTFTITGYCAEAFDCEEAALTGGDIAQDGTVSKSSPTIGTINDIIIKSIGGVADGVTSVLTSLNVGANDTGSTRNVVLTYKLNIPAGYSNSGTFDCDKTFSQPAVAAGDPTFECGDVKFLGGFISDQGNIAKPTVASGASIASFTPQFFDTVTTDTQRTVTFTINIPSTGYTNSGSTIDCDYTMTQAADVSTSAENAGCGSYGFYLSKVPAVDATFACTDVYDVKNSFASTATSLSELNTTVGQKICRRDTNGIATQPFNGGDNYWAFSHVQTVAGFGAGTFRLMKISPDGIVTDIQQVNCNNNYSSDEVVSVKG